jgi:hypothetical protein
VSPGAVLAVLWREALCPYLPWSAIALVCLADAGARPWSFAYLVALALHAPVACVFLAQGSPNFDERGAYLLPVAVPAVLASAAVLHGTRRWIALAIAAVISLAYVAPRWAPLYRREFVDAVAEIEREGSFAFLVGPSEIEGVRTHLAGTVAAEIVRSLEGFYGLQVPGDPVVALPAWFDATLRAFPDRVWIVTREAQDLMVRSELPEVRALWLRHVPQAYEQQPVQRRGFDGVALRPR